MSPIIHPDIWMHCQLSVAAHAGGCIVNGKRYVVHKSGYLVREDFVGVVNSLGAETVCKAIERYKPKKDKNLTMDEYKEKLISYILDAPKKDGQYIISSETILEMAREELIKRGVALEELTPEEKADFKNRLTEYFKRAEKKKSPTNYRYLLNSESILEIAKDVLIKQEAKK